MSDKPCFGILERVFPVGPRGLREVVPSCFGCPERKACLQAALHTREGLDLRREVLDRSPAKGLVGRIKRWSERKELSRRMREKEGRKRWL